MDGVRIGALGLDRIGQWGIRVFLDLWRNERSRFERIRHRRIERSQLEWSDLERIEWLGLGRERLQREWGQRERIELREFERVELGGIRRRE